MKLKYLIIITLSLFILFSCSNENPNRAEHLIVRVDSDNDSTQHLPTHIIDIKCGGTFIPIRNRILSRAELELSQRTTDEAKLLNDSVIIDNLNNGQWINILKADTLGYHYIKLVNRMSHTNPLGIRGYIVSKYCNKPTVRKFERVHLPEFDNSDTNTQNKIDFLEDWGVNLNEYDHAYEYVSHEADLFCALSFTVCDVDEICFEMYHSTGDRLSSTGIALLHNRYTNETGEQIMKFIAYKNPGAGFEILINETDNTALINFLDDELIFGVGELDGLEMKRIK